MSENEQPFLFSSSDYDEEELTRLLELQRRQAELLRPDIDNLDDFEDDDEFSVTGRKERKQGPTVPDFRFEKQFDKAVSTLKEGGASNASVFFSAVVKDQIIMPFVTGFTWNVCSTAWKWYRARGVINARSPKKFGFFRGIQHGITECTK
jgi:hypothetical protein